MSNFIIAIVSHGHFDYISSNKWLIEISKQKNVKVIIKDNLKENKLKDKCFELGFIYITSPEQLGFGENNNYIFNHSVSNYDFDWFLVINPDVTIDSDNFNKLTNFLSDAARGFYTVNLFKDDNYTEFENSLRYFPKLSNLLNPFLMKPINLPYDKSTLKNLAVVDWASGAFLCIRQDLYAQVGGFDESYFMYYEDVDFCYRLRANNVYLEYLPDIRAVHKGEYKNRSVFSKHFIWYLKSLFKFLSDNRV